MPAIAGIENRTTHDKTEKNKSTHYRTGQRYNQTFMEDKGMKKKGEIALMKPNVKFAQVFIEGDGDLVLNKMNARNERALLADDRKQVREEPNPWEDIITSIHWRDALQVANTHEECTEELFYKLLKENAPCITAFGLKKSFGDAVVRNEIDTYKTKFDNAVNIVAANGLIPVEFTEWRVDKRLMSPKRGAPVTVLINHFSGWRANFSIHYTEHVYSLSEIVNIINYAGFGLGIGSGRTSGYGRYHVVDVR